MTFDEVERSIQVLLAQQAQFASELQQAREQDGLRHQQAMEAIAGFSTVVGHLVDVAERHDQNIDRLEHNLDRLTDRVDQLTDRVDRLAEAQTVTEEHLQILLDTVDRYFRNRTNGGPH